MVVVDLDDNVVEGKWKPSSDTPTHIELYKGSILNGIIRRLEMLYGDKAEIAITSGDVTIMTLLMPDIL